MLIKNQSCVVQPPVYPFFVLHYQLIFAILNRLANLNHSPQRAQRDQRILELIDIQCFSRAEKPNRTQMKTDLQG